LGRQGVYCRNPHAQDEAVSRFMNLFVAKSPAPAEHPTFPGKPEIGLRRPIGPTGRLTN
jgi:hypothetical protein